MQNSKFKIVKTPIEGLVVIEPTIYGDQRGFFMESYAEKDFQEIGINDNFVQDNHSKSSKGVLRGMHFQIKDTQSKLVRVTAGAVLDVVVDLRPQSTTYGKWFSVLLSAENKQMLYVPKQFAHGFITLENDTEFLYKCSDYYNPQYEQGLMWNDQELSIDWKLKEYGIELQKLIISEKDTQYPKLKDIDKNKLWR